MTSRSLDPLQGSEILANPEALEAHVRHALGSRFPRALTVPPGGRRAAVLVPLVHAASGAALVLTKRTDSVEHHKGQISFPGGGVEDGESPLEAALRETHEEIGVPPREVRVLGELDDEEAAVSGFVLTPFVGTVPYPNRLRISPREVRAVLVVSVRTLLDPRNVRTEVWERRGAPFVMYFYTAGREVIWGATARIIARFLEVVFGVPLREP